MKYILLLFYSTFYGQVLHRQTLANQGGIEKTQTGILVTQSIGQQSVIGNFSVSTLRIGQGFQQSKMAGKTTLITEITSTIFAPNPFDTFITFTFSKAISSPIGILIFDISGKLVYNMEKTAIQNQLFLDNLNFPAGVYLVRLTANDLNYTAKIYKNK